jgi:uncharacterized metal-binding protein YceD (DUF177 family)
MSKPPAPHPAQPGAARPDQALPDLPLSHPFRSGALSPRKPTRFDLQPDAETRKAMADALGLLDLPAFRFKGEIRPARKNDFELEAQLTARIVQPCVISLAPVKASIDEMVQRRYLSEWSDPDGEEAEMPEDDTLEAIPEVIDVGAVALEALALALPLYPRAEGAEFGEVASAPPGAAPLRDDDLKPFAGLAGLKAKLEGGETP